jgi:hypothetical protein
MQLYPASCPPAHACTTPPNMMANFEITQVIRYITIFISPNAWLSPDQQISEIWSSIIQHLKFWVCNAVQWSRILHRGHALKAVHKPKIAYSQKYSSKSLKSCFHIYPVICMYIMYIMKSTYTSKMLRNFVFNYIKLNWYSGGVESNWIHSALWPLIGLLCQPWVIMMMEKLMEWLAEETEVLGENLPQCHFVHHKQHMMLGRKPRPLQWEASNNRLSYSTAF